MKLTKKRQAWAAPRKATLKGKVLRVPAAVEARYSNALLRLVRQMTAETKREVTKLFSGDAARAFFAEDANISSQARILVNKLTDKYRALFASVARPLAAQMVDSNAAASKTALHGSLAELTGGLSLGTGLQTPQLKTILNASVTENVSLIKSIPEQYLGDVQGDVMRSITTGNGLADLVPALEKYEGQTERRATNIALDQTRKVYNGINKGRMTAIGVKKYEWIHSGGGTHPRELHMEYDGQTFSFDDPPIIDERTGERGIPGQAINCRCTMRPVFDFDDDEKDS